MDSVYVLIGILVTALATFITRAFPFVIFSNKKPNKTLNYIEVYLPVMIMIILVFYALKGVNFFTYPFGIAELIGISIAFFLHVAFRQALLSIIFATLIYMFIMQKIF